MVNNLKDFVDEYLDKFNWEESDCELMFNNNLKDENFDEIESDFDYLFQGLFSDWKALF